MTHPPRVAAPGWPDIFLPAPGCLPPATKPDKRERILHIALRSELETQPGLATALRGIAAAYEELDWAATPNRRDAALALARDMGPTLVWMQIQCSHSGFDGAWAKDLRKVAPDAVIVNWDGDQHHEPQDPDRAWFTELGRVCDASLVCNTEHPKAYAARGVHGPGYLQIGIDPALYHPKPAPSTGAVAFLASYYGTVPRYQERLGRVFELSRRYGNRLAVHGGGWPAQIGPRPYLAQHQEAQVYGAAACAISMSIRADLPRYTSDRLFRALASGAYVLVERFPDMEGLGLVDGENCRAWTGTSELCARIDEVLNGTARDYQLIRQRASALAMSLHTWEARMPELVAIVDAVRSRDRRTPPPPAQPTIRHIFVSDPSGTAAVLADGMVAEGASVTRTTATWESLGAAPEDRDLVVAGMPVTVATDPAGDAGDDRLRGIGDVARVVRLLERARMAKSGFVLLSAVGSMPGFAQARDLSAEAYVQAYAAAGLRAAVMRIGEIYGPGVDGLVQTRFAMAKGTMPMQPWPYVPADFLYVDDARRAFRDIAQLLRSPRRLLSDTAAPVFVVASADVPSTGGVDAIIGALVRGQHAAQTACGVPFDTTFTNTQLGWSPQVRIATGLTLTMQAMAR